MLSEAAHATRGACRLTRTLRHKGCGTGRIPHLRPQRPGRRLPLLAEERADSLLARHHTPRVLRCHAPGHAVARLAAYQGHKAHGIHTFHTRRPRAQSLRTRADRPLLPESGASATQQLLAVLQLRIGPTARADTAQLRRYRPTAHRTVGTTRHHHLLAARHHAREPGHAERGDDLPDDRHARQSRATDRHAADTLQATLRETPEGSTEELRRMEEKGGEEAQAWRALRLDNAPEGTRIQAATRL